MQGCLMRALKKTRLVAEDATPESLTFSRSGRTDRGVSGRGQVPQNPILWHCKGIC